MNKIAKTVLSLMALTMLTLGASFAASKDGCCNETVCCPCCECCQK
jgi:hypothetical protein